MKATVAGRDTKRRLNKIYILRSLEYETLIFMVQNK